MKGIKETSKGLFIIYVLGFLSYLIPKKKNLIVFVPFFDRTKFSGNIKSLLLYSNTHYPNIETALISNHKEVIDEAKALDVNVVSSLLKSLWFSLRAEHLVIDASTIFFSIGRFSIIQLWHGTGFKRVALLYRGISNLDKFFVKKSTENYQFIVTTSESEAEKQNTSFATDNSVITGLPRNDLMFRGEKYINQLKNKYQIMTYNRVITYAPTWRDFQTKQPFSDMFYRRLNKYLVENNELFIVIKHPRDRFFNVPTRYSNIKDFTTKVDDIQQALLVTDLLITDYSSVMTDYVLTDKPLLVYAYDIKLYQKHCRSFDYDLEETLPKPFIHSENELLEKIQSDQWLESKQVEESYEEFKSFFHKYHDAQSSKRVMEKILALSETA